MVDTDKELWISPSEASRLIGVHRSYISAHRAAFGSMFAARVGARVLYRRDLVERFAEIRARHLTNTINSRRDRDLEIGDV